MYPILGFIDYPLVIDSEYSGYYICFRDYKDIRQYYVDKTRIFVPNENYRFSCTRNLDGSQLFIVETDSKYNITIKSCAVFEKDNFIKTFKDLDLKVPGSRYILKPSEIFHLFNKLGYFIPDLSLHYDWNPSRSHFGRYYYVKDDIRDRDGITSISLHSISDKKETGVLQLPNKYRISGVFEIQDGVMLIFVDKEITKIIINRIKVMNNPSISTNEYIIPQKWCGYTSFSIVEYHPNGDEIIFYCGQDYPLKGKLFLLNTKNEGIQYIKNSRLWCFFIND
jgi:hypothetical protein